MITLHPIQKEILVKFIARNNPSFTDLKPININNDLYNYHLKFLCKKGYVKKDIENLVYELTEKGVQYISNLDLIGNEFKLFKVSVAIYLFDGKKLLVQRRKRKPFKELYITVSGKVIWGEKIVDAGNRKLYEETGLTAQLRFVGVIRKIRRYKDNTILEDTLYHICYGDSFKGYLIKENKYGENSWLDINKAKNEFKKNVDFGDYDMKILNLLKEKKLEPFYFEQEKVIDSY